MSDLLAVALATENEDFRRRVRSAMFLTAATLIRKTPTTEDEVKVRFAAASVAGAAETLVWQFIWLCASDRSVFSTVTIDDAGVLTVGAADDVLMTLCGSAWRLIATMKQ